MNIQDLIKILLGWRILLKSLITLIKINGVDSALNFTLVFMLFQAIEFSSVYFRYCSLYALLARAKYFGKELEMKTKRMCSSSFGMLTRLPGHMRMLSLIVLKMSASWNRCCNFWFFLLLQTVPSRLGHRFAGEFFF